MVSLWQQCVGGASVYSVCADKLLEALPKVYAGVLSDGAANSADAGTATPAAALAFSAHVPPLC